MVEFKLIKKKINTSCDRTILRLYINSIVADVLNGSESFGDAFFISNSGIWYALIFTNFGFTRPNHQQNPNVKTLYWKTFGYGYLIGKEFSTCIIYIHIF